MTNSGTEVEPQSNPNVNEFCNMQKNLNNKLPVIITHLLAVEEEEENQDVEENQKNQKIKKIKKKKKIKKSKKRRRKPNQKKIKF